MKIKLVILLEAIILILLSPVITNVLAYPGEGDCRDYHGVTKIETPIDNSATINLDGVASEDFWSKPENQKGKVVIPVASITTDSNPPDILLYMNATFILSSNSVYILCEWEDNTTNAEDYYTDALLFCWNINVENFTAYYPSSMSTEHMGGGMVDSWKWRHHTSINSGVSALCVDDCFNTTGWIEPNPELSQVYAAFTCIPNKSYTVEIERSLTTNEVYDIQFNEKKEYLFNVAIYDNDVHESHAMSWTYSLDLTEETSPAPVISGYITSLMMVNITFVAIIVLYNIRYKSSKIKSNQ